MSAFWPFTLFIVCVVLFIAIIFFPFRRHVNDNYNCELGKSSQVSYMRRLKNLRIIIVFFGSLILIFGLLVTFFEISRVKNKSAKELEAVAQSVAKGFSFDLIAPLSFTASDTSKAIFHHISDQLKIVSSHYGYIQIYSMVMRDSVIYFGPGSQNEIFSTPIYPGTVYKYPPEGLESVFKTGKSLITNPYTDEFGYFMSAFAPVINPLTSVPVMVVGVDFNAEHLGRKVAVASIIPLSICFVLLLMLLGGAFFLTRRSILEFQSYSWYHSPEAHFTFLIGLIIGVLVILFAYTYERRYRQAIFFQSAEFHASRISEYFRSLDGRMQKAFRSRHIDDSIDTTFFSRRIIPILRYDFVDAPALARIDSNYDAGCRWRLLYYYDVLKGFQLENQCLEQLLINSDEKINNAWGLGLRGIDFLNNEENNIDQAIIYQPIGYEHGNPEMAFVLVVNSHALLNEAVASYGETDLFNIVLLEFLEDNVQHEIARSESLLNKNYVATEMHSQHLVFIFGRVFVLSMYPGPAFFAIHQHDIWIFILPVVILILLLGTFVIGVLTTERYRLEREVDQRTLELEDSESRFSRLFNSALDGIALHRVVRDNDGIIKDYIVEYANPAYCRLVGLTQDEVIGKTSEIIYGNSLSVMEVYSRIIDTGEPSHFNYFFKRYNRYLDISATLVRKDFFATIFSDITLIKEAEEALRNSEEKYRLLVENQNDMVFKIDLDGKCVYASPSFCRFFGKEEEFILGKLFVAQVEDEDANDSLTVLRRLFLAPHRLSFEQRVKSATGWRWVAWSNTAIIEDNQVKGYIGVGRDITQRKHYELALAKNQIKLQQQNDEYSSLNEEYQVLNQELNNTNKELLLAIGKAQESERLKTAFLQNMSHEIRTPLNAVIGFSEMISLAGFTDQEKEEFGEIVINNARQLLSLVDDIMAISSIETQQNRLSESTVRLTALLNELYTIFVSNLKLGVKLYISFPEPGQNDIEFFVDEMKLRQVLNNLIVNAIKFTHKGSITFGYDFVKDDYIRFFVKDTGIGIPSELQDKIFDRFRQAGENIQKNYGGTGLGLAISKGQVTLMGGQIWVESVPNKGSAFYFDLPFKTHKG